ncbi:MAG TPA: tetratricopeptide repeat protein [Gemmataceae bacterium]|jgi:tetratricopeptide (TPR) repeat protein|nr:tetratricopeptide repeat protein [Gemmataceae bacterium]
MSVIPRPPWHKFWSDAIYFKHSGEVPRAIELLSQAVELLRREPALTDELGVKLNSLAHMLLTVGRLTDAEAAARESMEIEIRQHESVSDSNLMTLARILHQQGRCDEAVRLGKQALVMRRKNVGWWSDYYRQSKKVVASFKTSPVQKPVQAETVSSGAA